MANGFGVALLEDLQYAGHPERSPRRSLPQVVDEAGELERTMCVLRDHPDYAAPPTLVAKLREIIDSGRYRMFDA